MKKIVQFQTTIAITILLLICLSIQNTHAESDKHDESKELQWESSDVNGEVQRIAKEYYQNGQLKSEWFYKDNVLEGIKHYYESGELQWELKYVAGKQEGVAKEYYESGKLKAEWPYKNNMLEGIGKHYYESDELQWEIKYVAGRQEGTAKEYDKNGTLKTQQFYRNGELAPLPMWEKISVSTIVYGIVIFIFGVLFLIACIRYRKKIST